MRSENKMSAVFDDIEMKLWTVALNTVSRNHAQKDHTPNLDLPTMVPNGKMIPSSEKARSGVGNPFTSLGEQSPRLSVAFFICAFVRCHGLRVSIVDGLVSWGGALLQRFLESVFPTPTARPPFMRRKHEERAFKQTISRIGTNAPTQFTQPTPQSWRVGLSYSIQEATL